MNLTVRYIYASMLGRKAIGIGPTEPYKTMVLTENRERIKFAKHMIDILEKRAKYGCTERKSNT